MVRNAFWAFWVLFALCANASPSLLLRVSSEAAQAGGSVQFKIFADAPVLIASGALSMDFDPTVFGSIGNIAVFSATGDAMGYANVNALHVDVHFSSPTASIGQLPGLPIFVVTISILSGLTPGGGVPVTIDPSGSPWTDGSGTAYSVKVMAGSVTVGNNPSIQSVTPGGGVLPAGSIVQIKGNIFQPADTVSIDGVSISSMQFIGPQQINVTLGAPTEMTGKHVHVTNLPYTNADYFASLPSAAAAMPDGFAGLPGVEALVPLAPLSTATLGDNTIEQPFVSDGLALLNPNLTPVTVVLQGVAQDAGMPYPTVLEQSVTIPRSTLFFFDATRFVSATTFEQLWIIASAPIRMLEYVDNARPPSPSIGVTLPAAATSAPPPLQVVVSGGPVNLSWQIGTPLPSATLRVGGDLFFNLAVSGSATPFLTVTPQQGTAPQAITVTPISSVQPGTYTATITVTPTLPAALASLTVLPTSIAVTLEVSTGSRISTASNCCAFFEPVQNNPATGPDMLTLTSNGTPAAFTVTLGACASGNWLSVTPSSGITPATLTFTANPVGLNLPGNLQQYQCPITIQGPANSIALTATLMVIGGSSSSPPPPVIKATPDFLDFQFSSPGLAPAPKTVSVTSNGNPITVSVETQSGGNWLSAVVVEGNPSVVTVSVSPTLAPGMYSGTVSIASAGLASFAMYVGVTVLGVPPSEVPLIATPSPVLLTGPAGSPMAQSVGLALSAPGGIPVAFTVSGSTSDGGNWLTIYDSSGITTADADIQASSAQLAPGIYHGSATVTWGNGNLVVPLIFTVTASLGRPPTTAAIVNAASQVSTPVSPGEIITIFGTGLGTGVSSLTLANGKVATTLGVTQVLINGISAPLIYASPSQVNAIVPYEVSGAAIANIQVESFGAPSAAWEIPVAPSSPAIFTILANGAGQGAVLNQDNSVNSASNPAARGSAIQIYATGGGQTSPASSTGTVAQGAANLTLPITVTIGGVSAQILYAGAAPGEVDGVVQINAIVPQGVTPGASVPLVAAIGGVASQAGVTLAVQ